MTSISASHPASDTLSLVDDATAVDRDLASALDQLGAEPHASSECQESLFRAGVEASLWVAAATTVWVVLAIAY
jgi:hypothetical protein